MWHVTAGQYKRLRAKILPKSIPDSVDNKVKAALSKLGPKSAGVQRPAECTRRVMRNLGRVGKKLGFAVHGVGDSSQWLYNQCWTDEDDNGTIQRLPLAIGASGLAAESLETSKSWSSREPIIAFSCVRSDHTRTGEIALLRL